MRFLSVLATERGCILPQQPTTAFDFVNDQDTRVLSIAGRMSSRRHLKAFLDKLLCPLCADGLSAGTGIRIGIRPWCNLSGIFSGPVGQRLNAIS